VASSDMSSGPNEKDTKPIVVSKIKIMLNTNIPSMSTTPFQFNMLYHPDLEKKRYSTTNYKTPYFTNNVKYPMELLASKFYSDRVDFFFNKSRFNKILRKTMIDYVAHISSSSETDEDAKAIDEQLNEHSEYNVKCMLILLFPIADEFENVFKTSYDQYILDKTSPEIYTLRNIEPSALLNPSWWPLYNYFGSREYVSPINEVSYLKNGGTTYIITDVIWQNDLTNHPVYRDFISVYNDKLTEIRNSKKRIDKEIKTQENMFIALMIKYLDKYKTNINTTSVTDIFKDTKIEFNKEAQDILKNHKLVKDAKTNLFDVMAETLIENILGSSKVGGDKRRLDIAFTFDDKKQATSGTRSDMAYAFKEKQRMDTATKIVNYFGSIDDILHGLSGDFRNESFKPLHDKLTKLNVNPVLDSVNSHILTMLLISANSFAKATEANAATAAATTATTATAAATTAATAATAAANAANEKAADDVKKAIEAVNDGKKNTDKNETVYDELVTLSDDLKLLAYYKNIPPISKTNPKRTYILYKNSLIANKFLDEVEEKANGYIKYKYLIKEDIPKNPAKYGPDVEKIINDDIELFINRQRTAEELRNLFKTEPRKLDKIINNILNAYIDYTNYNETAEPSLKISLKDYTRLLPEFYSIAIKLQALYRISDFTKDINTRLDVSEKNADGSSKPKLDLDIIRVLKQTYPYYVGLNNSIQERIKNVLEPYRSSSNAKLQEFFKYIINPSDGSGIVSTFDTEMLVNIYDKYISNTKFKIKKEYIMDFMNVGVSTIISEDTISESKTGNKSGISESSEMPEIYVYMNVVKKDDYEKSANRSCSMKDDSITNKLKNLLYSQRMLDGSIPEVNPYREYKLLNNVNDTNTEPTGEISTSNQIPVKGGIRMPKRKQNTRRIRRKQRATRKYGC